MATSNGANGPLCPMNPRHGRLLDRREGRGWYCPHHDHGGNGHFFTEDQALSEWAYTEDELNALYESTAKSILAGQIDLDSGAASVAKATKTSGSVVRERLHAMMEAVKGEQAEKAEQAEERKVAKKAKPAAKRQAAGPREKLEHVEPAAFKAVRDELGMSNKEVAAALEAAGMGCTLSRVTELTHSKGSSSRLFEQFKAALASWRESHPQS